MKFAVLFLAAAAAFAANDYSNRRAPGFSLSDSHYQQHDPQDYRGKVLLVDIVSTRCGTCMQLSDMLVQVKAKYGDRIGLLTIVTLPDQFDAADRFAKDHKITWPVLFDSGQVIASYLKVTPTNPQVHFPHLFVIDANGTIRNDYEGLEDAAASVESLGKIIDGLLK